VSLTNPIAVVADATIALAARATTWIALEAPETDPDASTPEVVGQEQVRSFVETLVEGVENDLLRRFLRDVLGPGLQILLILFLAIAVLYVIRRVIARTVERAKDPHAARGSRLRRRVGLADDGSPAYSLRRAQRADALGALLTSIAGAVIWVLAGFLVLAEIGVNLAPLVAGAGVVGLAIGFGAQNLVADFLSGVFMLAEDQYGVGDIVDVGEASGVVEGVTLRTTRIRDVEGTLWHVPNGEIRRVGNSSQDWARSLLDVGVAYQTDVDLAIEIIERVAAQMAHESGYDEQFLDEPEVWGVQALGPDSVDIRLVIKTQPGKQWAITRELRRRIKAAFDVAGVEIPFPQRTVWMRQDDGGGQPSLDRAAIERAIADAGVGDRGPEHAAKQDEVVVAQEVEEEKADDAGAVPAGEDAATSRGAPRREG
jgi:moderate conductance mechanosensitive channel